MCKTEDHVYINFIKLLELYGVSYYYFVLNVIMQEKIKL